MRALRLVEHHTESFDGTDLAYHTVGSGLPVLLCNGLGGGWRAWTHQIAYLEDRYRFVSWDYRGLYRSGSPDDPRALTIADQAADARAVLDREGMGRVAVFGWSMGVQVALELFRAQPERVSALVLVNGLSGHSRAIRRWRHLAALAPHLVRAASSAPHLVELLIRRVARWPETTAWAKRVGVASSLLDEELFQELLTGFCELDMSVYLRTLQSFLEHDVTHLLGQVDVPTLVIAGDSDWFTPRREAEGLVRGIPGAEFMLVPGGTHYTPIEFPELVNLRIEKFFQEREYRGESRP